MVRLTRRKNCSWDFLVFLPPGKIWSSLCSSAQQKSCPTEGRTLKNNVSRPLLTLAFCFLAVNVKRGNVYLVRHSIHLFGKIHFSIQGRINYKRTLGNLNILNCDFANGTKMFRLSFSSLDKGWFVWVGLKAWHRIHIRLYVREPAAVILSHFNTTEPLLKVFYLYKFIISKF